MRLKPKVLRMRKFSFALLLSLWLTAFADDKIVVTQITGQTVYTVSVIKELTFDGKGVKILFSDGEFAYFPAESLTLIEFNAHPSEVGNMKNTEQTINIQNGVVTVEGEACDIRVLSVEGKLVAQAHGTSLDISHLPDGAYVVQVEGLISKIVKR